MQHLSVRVCLLLLSHTLISADLKEVDEVPIEVIVESSPCSASCGVGVKTQTLCLLKDSMIAVGEDVRSKNETEVTDLCRIHKVWCQETWQCGLRTITVTSGERVDIDCLEEFMEMMGKFSWRVLWRYARGIISSDDSLFAHWEAPQLGRIILDPINEENAGTYYCEVQDATSHRVKSIYWGIRVLLADVNLDYESALAQWESTGNQTVFNQFERTMALFSMVLMSFSIAGVGAGMILLSLYWTVKRKAQSRDGCGNADTAHVLSS